MTQREKLNPNDFIEVAHHHFGDKLLIEFSDGSDWFYVERTVTTCFFCEGSGTQLVSPWDMTGNDEEPCHICKGAGKSCIDHWNDYWTEEEFEAFKKQLDLLFERYGCTPTSVADYFEEKHD